MQEGTMNIFFQNSDGHKLSGVLEQPNKTSKSVVIVVHGRAGHKNKSSTLSIVNQITKHDCNTFRIDLRGCGESEGSFEFQTISAMADDVLAAIKTMREKGFKDIHLLGSSAGGMAVMAAALQDTTIKSLGLKAPVSNYVLHSLRTYGQKYLDDWKKNGYNYYPLDDGKKLKLDYSFYTDAKKYIMTDLAHKLKLPILIIHGTKDQFVPIEDSILLMKVLKKGVLLPLEGADHALAIDGDPSKANTIFAEWFSK